MLCTASSVFGISRTVSLGLCKDGLDSLVFAGELSRFITARRESAYICLMTRFLWKPGYILKALEVKNPRASVFLFDSASKQCLIKLVGYSERLHMLQTRPSLVALYIG